jgi:hypothetical protein
MTPHEEHNMLANKFVFEIIGPLTKRGATHEELMVLFESIIFGMLQSNTSLYNIEPQDSVLYIELAMHEAIKRFTEKKPTTEKEHGR